MLDAPATSASPASSLGVDGEAEEGAEPWHATSVVRAQAASDSDINVTPLVDVVLVLLIIFMVVTPLLTKQMWMNVPAKPDKSGGHAASARRLPPVVLTVDKAGALRINREEVSREQVVARLQRMLNARAGQDCLLRRRVMTCRTAAPWKCWTWRAAGTSPSPCCRTSSRMKQPRGGP